MIHHTCSSCRYHRPSLVYGNACFRPYTMADGTRLDGKDGVGRSIEFATAGSPEIRDYRDPMDHCGPERRHHTGRAR